MKKLVLQFSSILTIAIFLNSCGSVEKPQQYSIEQFMDVISVNGGSFSIDESKLLVNSNESGIFNAIEIDISSGEQKSLTTSETNSVFSRSYFPNDNRFVFASDRGGNEITHLYVQNPGGKIIDLISDSTAKAEFVGWSFDKQKLYYTSNSRDKRYFDLYKISVESLKSESEVVSPQEIFKNEKGFNISSISRDEKYIALTESITTSNTNIYLLESTSGEIKLITPHQGDIQYSPQYFSTDGSRIILFDRRQ